MPRFAQVFAFVLGLTFIVVIALVPLDAWRWALDPIGSAFDGLAGTTVFYVGPHDVEGELPPEMRAWRTLARASGSDSLFRQLYLRGKPAARVYALLGLARADTSEYRRLLGRMKRDTLMVWVWDPCKERGQMLPMAQIITHPLMDKWLEYLESWNPTVGVRYEACAV
jgi:hypothetical protein